MAAQQSPVTQKESSNGGTWITKLEKYYNENQKSLMIIGGVAIFLVVAFFAYIKFYKQPKEIEGRAAMWKAEYWFEVDSFKLAITGNDLYPGFEQLADDYSGTDAGNLANYYLGVCYLNTGEYEAAIESLEKVDFDDQLVSSLAIGATGDAYMELGNIEEAIDLYEEAAENNTNSFTTPLFLKKAALAYEDLGNFEKAAEYYQRIYDEFETSAEFRDIEKYLYRAKNSKAAN
jgi:tetratricopeptide (TPR) repeat protein